MRKTTFAALAIVLFTAVAASAEVLFDGFEGENYWRGADWENTGQVNIQIVPDGASDGRNAMMVIIREEATGWKNKVAVYKEANGADFSKYKQVFLDAYVPSAVDLEAAIGFRTGGDWTYYESSKKPLNKGWNRDVAFSLGAKDYKCKASDWKYGVPLAGKNNVNEFYILVYRPVRMARDVVYIDNVRIK